jgi:hypothetical protein
MTKIPLSTIGKGRYYIPLGHLLQVSKVGLNKG